MKLVRHGREEGAGRLRLSRGTVSSHSATLLDDGTLTNHLVGRTRRMLCLELLGRVYLLVPRG